LRSRDSGRTCDRSAVTLSQLVLNGNYMNKSDEEFELRLRPRVTETVSGGSRWLERSSCSGRKCDRSTATYNVGTVSLTIAFSASYEK